MLHRWIGRDDAYSANSPGDSRNAIGDRLAVSSGNDAWDVGGSAHGVWGGMGDVDSLKGGGRARALAGGFFPDPSWALRPSNRRRLPYKRS